jgi:hypothetical protein
MEMINRFALSMVNTVRYFLFVAKNKSQRQNEKSNKTIKTAVLPELIGLE